MSFLLTLYNNKQVLLDKITLPEFFEIYLSLRQYFIMTVPAKWNFGGYKRHSEACYAKYTLEITDATYYGISWVGILQDIYFEQFDPLSEEDKQVDTTELYNLRLQYAKAQLEVSFSFFFDVI